MLSSRSEGMAQEVTHAVEFRDPIQQSFGPDRFLFVVVTDTGNVIEFQRFEDSGKWSLKRRGSISEPVHGWSQSRARLPADVIETMDDILGDDNWTK